MSLLDRGPHTLQVQLAETVPDQKYGGTKKTYGAALRVVGASVQPLSAEEVSSLGLQAQTSYRVICRSWPGGVYSRVVWNGREWFQRGDTLHHTTGRLTQHDTAIILAADAEVK